MGKAKEVAKGLYFLVSDDDFHVTGGKLPGYSIFSIASLYKTALWSVDGAT